MRLLAISDLHLASPINREAVSALPEYSDDWIILGGDIAEKADNLAFAFREFSQRFARVIWVPGNHELWTTERPGDDASEGASLRGVARYEWLVELARSCGVHTPEDGFLTWPGGRSDGGHDIVIAPLFLLYDYSFRPDNVALEDVRSWAEEEHASCSDEFLLHPEPFASRQDWCHALCDEAEEKLAAIPADCRTVLINHWPLREDLIFIPRVPRFKPWCGTRRTADWHQRFRADVVVSGHLHTRRTDYIDGTRFEEVSLGYTRQWDQSQGLSAYLRDVTPA